MACSHPNCDCIFAGDINVNLGSSDVVASCLAKCMSDCCLSRCDDLFPTLNQRSCIDFILVSAINDVTYFEVLNPDINFSDRLPFACSISVFVCPWPCSYC